ncbi:hypothetical protein Ancab_024705 [Ancistrocladus abbreviatus]
MTSQQKSSSNQALSFEDISKFFSLPLSEAADILGVLPNALKTLCNENGLERWPHRKYLAGKSIEEIKIEAAKEKGKALSGFSQVDRQRNNAIMGSAVSSSLGSQLKDKSSRPASEISKSHGFTQQQGSRNAISYRSQNLPSQGLTVETSTCLDEFKHGFPSNGLSTYINRWWGGGTHDSAEKSEDKFETGREEKCQSDEPIDDDVSKCREGAEGRVEKFLTDKQGTVSLSALRKRAVEDGQEALKLGVWKEYGVDKVGEKEKLLLYRLFRK